MSLVKILAYLPAQHLVESGEWRCDPVSVKESVKMGLFKKFARMMEPPNREGSGVYWVTARCSRCGETIRARVNLSNDLSPEYDGETLTFVCRKVLIGEARCFQQVEVWLKFDQNRKLLAREISGGSFADESVEQPL